MKTNISVRAGFTLLEIILVITILGILLAIAYPYFRSSLARTEVEEAQRNIVDAFDFYHAKSVMARTRYRVAANEHDILFFQGDEKTADKCLSFNDNIHLVLSPNEIVIYPDGFYDDIQLSILHGKTRCKLTLKCLAGRMSAEAKYDDE